MDEKGKKRIMDEEENLIFLKILASTVVLKMMARAMMMKADAEVNDVNYSSGGGRAIARSPVQSNCQQSHLYRQQENAVELYNAMNLTTKFRQTRHCIPLLSP